MNVSKNLSGFLKGGIPFIFFLILSTVSIVALFDDEPIFITTGDYASKSLNETITGNWDFTGNITFVNITGIDISNGSYYWITDEGILDNVIDINAGDITDDGTYWTECADSNTCGYLTNGSSANLSYLLVDGNVDISNEGSNTDVVIHGGAVNQNASLVFEEVGLDRWILLLNGLDNNFYLWNGFSDSPAIKVKLNTNEVYFYNNTYYEGDAIPETTLTYDLGSPTNRWNNTYMGYLSADSGQISGDLEVLGTINATTLNVTNMNVKNVWVINMIATGNLTGDHIIGKVNCSNITGATSDLCTLVDTDTTYTNLSEFIDDLGHIEDNTSWNKTYADTLYATSGSLVQHDQDLNTTDAPTFAGIKTPYLNTTNNSYGIWSNTTDMIIGYIEGLP